MFVLNFKFNLFIKFNLRFEILILGVLFLFTFKILNLIR
ncbi:hypothetical protein CAMRE0001_0333 [Campylobacter rectus RM3267]|uniref:Uncharacterized protein n=1 Tax=Campylobacter rectus RM3267 TaxID=553218 RepID=B9D5Y5_CAMRE|nr:hypothetical protein CAMRE0001_0333 [Campylobacter rectus RM3267]